MTTSDVYMVSIILMPLDITHLKKLPPEHDKFDRILIERIEKIVRHIDSLPNYKTTITSYDYTELTYAINAFDNNEHIEYGIALNEPVVIKSTDGKFSILYDFSIAVLFSEINRKRTNEIHDNSFDSIFSNIESMTTIAPKNTFLALSINRLKRKLHIEFEHTKNKSKEVIKTNVYAHVDHGKIPLGTFSKKEEPDDFFVDFYRERLRDKISEFLKLSWSSYTIRNRVSSLAKTAKEISKERGNLFSVHSYIPQILLRLFKRPRHLKSLDVEIKNLVTQYIDWHNMYNIHDLSLLKFVNTLASPIKELLFPHLRSIKVTKEIVEPFLFIGELGHRDTVTFRVLIIMAFTAAVTLLAAIAAITHLIYDFYFS